MVILKVVFCLYKQLFCCQISPPPPHTTRALIQFFAENPQICFQNYKYHTRDVARVCFGKNNIDEVPKKYLYRLDIVELIKKYNYVPNGLIVIKESDTHHYNVHIKYLQDNIPAQQRNNLKIEVIPASIDNTGHTPLNLEQFKQRLEYLDIMANMYKNYDKYYNSIISSEILTSSEISTLNRLYKI